MKKNTKVYLISAGCCASLIAVTICYFLFSSISTAPETSYIYIDGDDNIDSVSVKVDQVSNTIGLAAFKTLARHTGYAKHIRTGRYALDADMGSLTFFRNLRNGHQSAVKLTIPSVRTKERLAEELCSKIMIDADNMINALNDNSLCQKYGLDTASIVSMFIPNTYEVYWDTSLDKLFERMKTESDNFWDGSRLAQAKTLELTPLQVITIASIIDEETANNGEKPMIAGMYYNRLKQGMPLQADPTIKFALKQFELRRIYNKLLLVDSPYNTYRNVGLPPGPIRIPSVAGIDAVLNLVHHDYLYMCAKEDFSGTHNFAKTYAEHLQNAAKYSKALDQRNIK